MLSLSILPSLLPAITRTWFLQFKFRLLTKHKFFSIGYFKPYNHTFFNLVSSDSKHGLSHSRDMLRHCPSLIHCQSHPAFLPPAVRSATTFILKMGTLTTKTDMVRNNWAKCQFCFHVAWLVHEKHKVNAENYMQLKLATNAQHTCTHTPKHLQEPLFNVCLMSTPWPDMLSHFGQFQLFFHHFTAALKLLQPFVCQPPQANFRPQSWVPYLL